MMKSFAMVVTQVLDDLKSSGYVEGFNDSVVQKVGTALEEQLGVDYSEWWNDNCMVEYEFSMKQQDVLSKWFNGNSDLFDRYLEQIIWSKENSKFVMPSWGTYGT